MKTDQSDLFLTVLSELSGGTTARRLSDELREAVRIARARGKRTSLTFTLTLKPIGTSGQYEVYEESKSKLPDPDRGINLLWGTPEGNLTITDPRQGNLDLATPAEGDEGNLILFTKGDPDV